MKYTIIFFILSSFVLGILFLFLLNIPIEALLKSVEASQLIINIVMISIIFLWLIGTYVLSLLFHYYIAIEKKNFKYLIYILAGVFCLNILIFSLLMSTDNFVIAKFKGTVIETEYRYTFGPYPSEVQLEKLKRDGYKAIVSLLSPTIPFEKVLLEKELAIGKKINLKIYSFPMLPWISKNIESIESIKELIKNNKKDRYYIHCYLGKHRVGFIKLLIKSKSGQALVVSVPIYPDKLERGKLLHYQNGKILLGGYPTDEEWFSIILRAQVKEVISFLDPKDGTCSKNIEQEKVICKDMGMKFKSIPIKRWDVLNGVKKIIDYIKETKHKIFIHGFITDDVNILIDSYLKTGATPIAAVYNLLERNKNIFKINKNIFVSRENIIDPNFIKTYKIKALNINDIHKGGSLFRMANDFLDYLSANKGIFYVYGFNDDVTLERFVQVVKNRFYGFNKIELSKIMKDYDMNIITNRIIVGPSLDENMLEKNALNGISTVIYVKGRDKVLDKEIKSYKKLVESKNLKFIVIKYKSGYLESISKEAMIENGICYITTPPSSFYQISQEIMSLI